MYTYAVGFWHNSINTVASKKLGMIVFMGGMGGSMQCAFHKLMMSIQL